MALTLLNIPQWAVESFKQKDWHLSKHFTSLKDGFWDALRVLSALPGGMSVKHPQPFGVGSASGRSGGTKQGIQLLESQIHRLFPS